MGIHPIKTEPFKLLSQNSHVIYALSEEVLVLYLFMKKLEDDISEIIKLTNYYIFIQFSILSL